MRRHPDLYQIITPHNRSPQSCQHVQATTTSRKTRTILFGSQLRQRVAGMDKGGDNQGSLYQACIRGTRNSQYFWHRSLAKAFQSTTNACILDGVNFFTADLLQMGMTTWRLHIQRIPEPSHPMQMHSEGTYKQTGDQWCQNITTVLELNGHTYHGQLEVQIMVLVCLSAYYH